MISIIDIEASGFGSESYPIEIGVITREDARYCSLVRPFDDWVYWDHSAEDVHGISREKLLARGSDPKTVCRKLNDFLKSSTVYSDAWVHDSAWLNSLFYRTGIRQQFFISPIESVASEAQLAIWDNIKVSTTQRLGGRRHRASIDAMIIQKTYEESFLKSR